MPASARRSKSSRSFQSRASSSARRLRSSWTSAANARMSCFRAAASTRNFDGTSPRNCKMPRSTVEQRLHRSSTERESRAVRSSNTFPTRDTICPNNLSTRLSKSAFAFSRRPASDSMPAFSLANRSIVSRNRCSSSSRRCFASSSTRRSSSENVEPSSSSFPRRRSFSKARSASLLLKAGCSASSSEASGSLKQAPTVEARGLTPKRTIGLTTKCCEKLPPNCDGGAMRWS
mmetsp:Transcript_124045/g.356135  ORF Transcript_124045/g.356135 Transcript_124045/m.356135 type:complete len:232 (-) Transcript_124045:406-1101(-)